jgi:hypothetical protein
MDRSPRNSVREQQPASIHAVQKPGDAFGSRIHLLDLEKDQLTQSADPKIPFDEAIELMAMHRQMPLALVFPNVALVNGHPDQVRHQVGEAGIVVALDPNHFNLALWIGKLADVGTSSVRWSGGEN